ncbi:methyl-accepting chemotaxis protein [Magnetospirillum sulfuroxidans]|uniref:HAMP domain-containing protein n=1 Tax=Magnetospirillum sulfuroxidans TaxID=611300 RepID=A0ABS5I9Y9_9PROT|nr:HAMP domain-containing methyl-accepting chemotaxis protein [Magnetospirillum sulfuroxidans]MBR9971244.1 HAMP domain-containing protein [Magnetospirillum sulfuroxidans]
MSIRAIINALLGSLAIVAILAVTTIAVGSLRQWQGAERAALQGRLSDLLLQASGQWAAERGLTAGALGAEQPATADLLKRVAERRAAGDAAMAEALAAMPQLEFSTRGDLSARVQERQRQITDVRRTVDAALAEGKTKRQDAVITAWFPTSSGLIESALMLRLGLIQANSQTPLIAMTEDLRSQLAVMEEYAGRERGYANGVIAAGRPLTGADMAVLGEFRGRVLGAWEFARILARQQNLNTAMAAPVAEIEQQYFGTFERLRASVHQAGQAGQAYPLAAGDWFAAATAAMATITKAQAAAAQLAVTVTANQQTEASRVLIMSIGAAAIALSLCLLGLVVTQNRVIGPVRGMERTMTRLSGGDLDAEVLGDRRHDEIGAMARALRVFRDTMREAAGLRQQQENARQLQAEERRQALLEMADTLEVNVQGIVGEVVTAATQLNSHSLSLSALARQAQEQTGAAAGASEAASGSVQTVASAAEELSASIAEISRQVGDSATFSQEAVAELGHTNASMESLLEAVSRVGEVTSLISQIASQTNLLALNATIEAARAGEAGKGFAVVANEVKALANQTAKATDEIAQQISAIQATTSVAAGAMDLVGGTIRRIHETAAAISVAVEQQGAATSEIARSVSMAAAGSHQVCDNIGGLSQAANETHAQADHVHDASEVLSSQAERLRAALGHFLDGLRAA